VIGLADPPERLEHEAERDVLAILARATRARVDPKERHYPDLAR
jgi:hypothetical protein